MVYEINNPFNPSIKLLPLTKISKQKAEKKHAKNVHPEKKGNPQ